MALNNAAVFIDKDGTLLFDVPYNVDPARVRLNRGAGEALRQLQDTGYRLIVVSNQSGVGRHYFPQQALSAVSRRIRELLQSYGVTITDFYYCPHVDADRCACRKPQPGMLLQAAAEHDIDLSRSWMIGDILNDVEAGNRAGCRTVLLDSGHETEWKMNGKRQPDYTVSSLPAGANIVGQHAMEAVR